MERSKIVLGGMALTAVTALAGCSVHEEAILNQGYSFEAPDTGVGLVSRELFNRCGSWTPYNVAFNDENVYDDIYYCTGDVGFPMYMYKGVFAINLPNLLASSYYKTQATDKSEVYVDDSFKSGNSTLAFVDYDYVDEVYEDPTARFNEALDETEAEGVLVTQEEIDANEWVESEDDPDVLISQNDNSAMYMGALFASMMMLNNSSYYKSKGTETSGIAVPASYMSGNRQLGYSNRAYYSDKGNIKSTNTVVRSSQARSFSKAGLSTSPAGKATIKAGGTSVRGGTGIGSGARGGGAS